MARIFGGRKHLLFHDTRRDVPSFLPTAAFHPRTFCILWWLFISSTLTDYIIRRMERKQKHLGWQLRHTALPTTLVGLVLRSFNDSYKVSQQWQICQLHWTSTASGQHTSTGSLTFYRLRNLSMVGRSVFLKGTVSSHSNMKEIKYKIKYKYIRGLDFHCQKSTFCSRNILESCKVVACACIIRQTS